MLRLYGVVFFIIDVFREASMSSAVFILTTLYCDATRDPPDGTSLFSRPVHQYVVVTVSVDRGQHQSSNHRPSGADFVIPACFAAATEVVFNVAAC